MPRKNNFIEYACEKIREYDLPERNLFVVVPTLRLQRALTKKLAEPAKEKGAKPRFLPRFTTIDNLTSEFSLLRKGDPTELTAYLYAAYRDAYKGEEADMKTPDQFFDWASILISDFNTIDNQLSPAQEILTYIAEEKRIGSWHLDLGEREGELQSRYLKFYRKLWPIYRDFTSRLLKEGCAYSGLIGRTAAERLPELLEEGVPPEHNFYLFLGLNALTEAEKKIIKTLVRAGKAETVWNVDIFYMEEGSPREAGYFLRQYRKDPDLNHNLGDEDFSDTLRSLPYRIIGCPQNTGQARTAARLLKENPSPHTLVVLNDESLLPSLMNALDENISCNISIACTLNGTRSDEMFHLLLQAREQIRQSDRADLDGTLLIRLLQNPLFRLLCPKTDCTKLIKNILDRRQNRFDRTAFLSFFPTKNENISLCADFIYEPEKDMLFTATVKLCRFLLGCQENLFHHKSSEIRYLSLLQEACDRQDNILKSFPDIPFGPQSLRKIFESCLSQITVNYTGDADNRINITGMLETRGMCFDRVILLSMSEGIMPEQKSEESFLLYSVKRDYHLPAEKEHTAMSAHHFYSLLQNCREAVLLYTTSQGDTSREPSRFLLQLQHELPQSETEDGKKENKDYPYPLLHSAFKATQTNSIEKTPAVLQALKDWLTKKNVSYSALSLYLSCPMYFYYQRILGIAEPPEVADEMDPGTKGSVFHNAMERFFNGKGPDKQSRLNRLITPEDVNALTAQKFELVEAAIEEEFEKGTWQHGVNRLAYQEILFWMDRYAVLLRKEVENGKLTVLDCEKMFRHVIPDAVDGKGMTLIGFADRIDVYDDGSSAGPVLRITDYKTGEVKKLELEGNSVYDNLALLETADGKQALQLLLYLYLYRRTNARGNRKVQAHICSVRKKAEMHRLHGGFLENTDLDEIAAQTEAFIRKIIAKILDPEEPITAAPSEDSCKYCPYTEFCGSQNRKEEE